MVTVSVTTSKHATDRTASAARKDTIIFRRTAWTISATRAAAMIKTAVKGKERTTPMNEHAPTAEKVPILSKRTSTSSA